MPDQLPEENKPAPALSRNFAGQPVDDTDPAADEAPQRREPSPRRVLEEESAAREAMRLTISRKQAQLRVENERARKLGAEADRMELEAASVRARVRAANAEAEKQEAESSVASAKARTAGAEALKSEHEAEIPAAQVRDLDAGAEKKRQEAGFVAAQALKAKHAADHEPAHQRQALFAGWTRIGLTIFLTLVSTSLLIVGYLIDPVAYVPALAAGVGLYPFKPGEFVFSRPSKTEEGDDAGGGAKS